MNNETTPGKTEARNWPQQYKPFSEEEKQARARLNKAGYNLKEWFDLVNEKAVGEGLWSYPRNYRGPAPYGACGSYSNQWDHTSSITMVILMEDGNIEVRLMANRHKWGYMVTFKDVNRCIYS